jgi:predicted transcriptional regulator
MNQFVSLSQNKNDKIKYLLFIIDNSPGIRYMELLRMTGFNNGTLSHYLAKFEKHSLIKVLRNKNNNTSRYYSNSIPSESLIVLGYLRSAITRDIIIKLLDIKCSSFCDLTRLIDKCPSTTAWYLKNY